MCFGHTILANRQGSAADSLRVIEGRTRRRHVDEFQTDLDIGAVLFQLDTSSGFKRDCAAAYFCAVSFCSGFGSSSRIIAACNGKRPTRRRPAQIIDLVINLRNTAVFGKVDIITVYIGNFSSCGVDILDKFISVDTVLNFLAFTFYRQSFVCFCDCKFNFISVGNAFGVRSACFQFPGRHAAHTLRQAHFFFEFFGVERVGDVLLVVYCCGEYACRVIIFGFCFEGNGRFFSISQGNVRRTACSTFDGKSAFKIINGRFNIRHLRLDRVDVFVHGVAGDDACIAVRNRSVRGDVHLICFRSVIIAYFDGGVRTVDDFSAYAFQGFDIGVDIRDIFRVFIDFRVDHFQLGHVHRIGV